MRGPQNARMTATWPSLIGAEMMTNGDCSSGTGWTLGAGVAIAAGKMTATTSTSSTANSGVPDGAFVSGGTYRNAFTIDSVTVAGTGARVSIGATNGTLRTTAATFSQDIVAPASGAWAFSTNGVSMVLDNFSVKSVGLMGVEADWTLTGGASWGAGSPIFGGGAATASLTGAAATSFDAAVSNNTACSVTIYTNLIEDTLDGTVAISLKGGVSVNFVGDGATESITHTVTSGSGSGFSADGGAATGKITRVQIALP